MNTKTLLKNLNNIKPVFVAIVLLVGISFVAATTWSVPDINGTNTGAPINQGTPNQTKQGSLTVGALVNSAHAPIVTFSHLRVGSSSLDTVSSNFYGPLNLFGVFDNTASADMPLCTNSQGKVKLCSDKVQFSAVNGSYYSPTLTTSQTVSFPSGGVNGAVSYSIDPAYSCTTVQAKDAITNNTTTDTTWPNGTTLTGSNSGYNITFNRWGSFILGITCTNGKTYSTTIDIKGKIKPTNSSVQKFLFSNAKSIEIKAIGGGGDDGTLSSGVCSGVTDGLPAFAHVTSSSSWTPNSGNNSLGGYVSGANVIHAGGGYGPANGINCYGKGGDYVTYSSSASNITRRNGVTSLGSNGGCPGSNPTSCNTNADDGAGGYGQRGGGGGSYASLVYQIPSSNYLYVYNGGGVGSQGTPGSAKPASLIVEWK